MNHSPSTSTSVDRRGSSNDSKGGPGGCLARIAGAILLAAVVLAILEFLGVPAITRILPCGGSLQVDCGPSATATSTPVPPAPVTVQSNTSRPGSTTLNKVSFNHPVQPGDLIVVAITQRVTTLEEAPTDNRNDTFMSVISEPFVFADPQDITDYVELYYAKNVAGGSTTVTVTFNPPTNLFFSGDSNVGIYEFSNLSAIAPLDYSASTTGGSQSGTIDQRTTLTGPSLGVSGVNDLCFAVGVDSGINNSNDAEINKAPSSGSGFKLLDQQDDSVSYERFYAEFEIVPIGSFGCQPSFTIPYNSYWAVVGATFKH